MDKEEGGLENFAFCVGLVLASVFWMGVIAGCTTPNGDDAARHCRALGFSESYTGDNGKITCVKVTREDQP